MSIKFESPLIFFHHPGMKQAAVSLPNQAASTSERQARQEVDVDVFFRCTSPGIVPNWEAQFVELHCAFGPTNPTSQSWPISAFLIFVSSWDSFPAGAVPFSIDGQKSTALYIALVCWYVTGGWISLLFPRFFHHNWFAKEVGPGGICFPPRYPYQWYKWGYNLRCLLYTAIYRGPTTLWITGSWCPPWQYQGSIFYIPR